MLEGDSTRRPIDSVIANLNDIAQNLTLIVENPQMTAQATTSLQTQVAALRNNASRMPPPFSDMLRGAAAEFEGSIAASTAGQLLQSLRDQVTPVCQQTITNRYPFVRGSNQEVPLGDFAKLFSPNGVMDKFFTQFLAPYADTSRPEWTWRKESPVGRSLSPETLKQFQNAAYIRDAFFQTGGNVPQVSLAIKPPRAPAAGVDIKTEIGGTVIASPTAPGHGIGFRLAAITAGRKRGAADHGAMAGSVGAHRDFGQQRHRTSLGARADRSVVAVSDARGRLAERKGRNRERQLHRRRPGAELSDLDRIDPQSAQSDDTQGVPLSQWNLNVMRCGLFGKLGAKRDFIALATPRAFLEAWEPWVQSSLSASRHQLGERWQQAFLTAPVWRFWLGAEICGTTVAGAIMPSLDGMGRYYPLTLHAIADAVAPIPPPDIDAQDEWFGMAEEFLLSTLSGNTTFADISAALDNLAAPTHPIQRRPARHSVARREHVRKGACRTGFRNGADGAARRQSRGLCGRELLVDGWWRGFSADRVELPRLAGPISLFHSADGRSR